MKNIRKGDEVIVIAGKDKGRRGTVVRVDGDRVVVENVNVVKKHQKPNPAKNTFSRVHQGAGTYGGLRR